MSYLQLSKPLTLPCGVTLKNRFLKSAMSETMALPDHQPDDHFATLYRQWALGGAGVIITGNVMVDRHALAEPGNVVVDDARELLALERWAAAGKQNHTQIWLQLNHPGRQAPRALSAQPVAPSAVPITGKFASAFNHPRALTTVEVQKLVGQYVKAASLAQQAGFTGVQIHGAFGYLVTQFLSAQTNQRSDQYGGSLTNRMRFLVEIYQGIRKACGAKFPISLKLSATDVDLMGFSELDFKAVVSEMAQLGIDLIEIAGDDYANSAIGFPGLAHLINQFVDVPIALSGGFRQISTMEEALGRGDAAMIGICTPMVVMPDLPNRILAATYQPFAMPLTTGNRWVDNRLQSVMVNGYCEAQMKRLGAGKSPEIYANGWRAVWDSVRLHGRDGLRTRRPVRETK